MKRFVLIMAALLSFAAFSKADRPLAFDKLPILAQEYVKSNFPDLRIETIQKDGSEFDVYFETGLKVEFNKKGEWVKIKNKINYIDTKLIPALIREKVSSLYPNAKYEKIEKDGKNYEIELSNGAELTFKMSDFKLVHIDD